MVQKAVKFTPEVLLSAPRRSAGVPNPRGDTVAYTVSSYSFDSHAKDTVLRVLDVHVGCSFDLVHGRDVNGIAWLDDHHPIFLCSESDGSTSLCVARIPRGWRTGEHAEKCDIDVLGKIDGPVSDLRIAKLPHSHGTSFAVVFAGRASSDGSLFNPDKAKKVRSTGRLYDKLYVRHWDAYETKERNSLFYAKLSQNVHGGYSLSKVSNALHGTALESPVPPFGGTDNFDICHNCIIFVAKDPDLDPAYNTKSNVYIIRIPEWDDKAKPVLQEVIVPGYEGASASPVLSSDGLRAAFLRMRQNGYEADRNEVFLLGVGDASVSNVRKLTTTTNTASSERNDIWDRSPSSIVFTADGNNLLAIAEDIGTAKLFLLYAGSTESCCVKPLTKYGYVNDVKPLSHGSAFISGSSLVDNSFFAVVDPICSAEHVQRTGDFITWSHSNSAHGGKFGLHASQVSTIWTPASKPSVNKEVHSIVVKPSTFDPNKTYPVAYIIHGGPQGSWADNWSTRWNLAVFAEQGYICIAPNPTGSTGYGQEFTDAIRHQWGSWPYEDIVNVFEWVGKNIPQADNERAVALGASYGGYMMNWIQGHDLGRKFKALVCHDGILSFAGMLSSEEMYFPFWDIAGTPWYDPWTKGHESTPSKAVQVQRRFGSTDFADWRRWDPSEHLSEWATPELVIHSSRDYRICIADGLAAFNVLQARGVESQFLTFPDENHWVLKPENSLVWHKVVLNWINKYVGLPAFTEQDADGEECWGGVVEGGKEEEPVEMMTQGKPEM